MTDSFAVSFDYRCPFARNAEEAVVTGLREGRDWDVRFLAFSLDQVHVAEGEPPVWERPPAERGSGVLAVEWGIAVRDAFPTISCAADVAIFVARHDLGGKLAEESVLREAIGSIELDPGAVAAEVATGRPLQTLAAEHTEAVKQWAMFGVPTFVVGDRAAFVRLMERDRPEDVDRVLELFAFERLERTEVHAHPEVGALVRMSDTEAVMWAVEKDPALRSDFCNLTILDHAPDEKRLRVTLDRALVAIPRLRQHELWYGRDACGASGAGRSRRLSMCLPLAMA